MKYKWTSRRFSFATSYILFGTIFFGLYWLVSFEVAVGVLLTMILGHVVWLGDDKFEKYKKKELDKSK